MEDNKQPTQNPWDAVGSVAMVSSFVPRRCGIATFTRDLTDAVASRAAGVNVLSVAMNDRPEGYRYPQRVWFEINQNRLPEYRLAADFLNMSHVDVCCIQHEFGIFGGTEGAHILDLIRRLRMPVVATLHTVLREPNDEQREVMRRLAESCDRFIIMADRAKEFLRDIYQVPDEKIALIPHGIPDTPFVDPNFYKDHFGVEGKKVILTFGLLSPNKGLEFMIEAMPRIVERHPDAVYIILGATHPGVVAHSGEEYRIGLQRRAKELGVDKNIEWVNKFVELDELIEFLGAADVYVTPYLNEAQITSGTLAYALGTGKATVSTPYWHAEELLADGRGKLVPFREPGPMADAVIELFDHEQERHAMRKRAYQHMRSSAWSNVAGQYLDLFQQVTEERHRNPKPVPAHRQLRGKGRELAEIKLDHLLMLSDDTGVFQYAKSTVPDRRGGYTTDDNARALIAILMAQDHVNIKGPASVEDLVCRFLGFLQHAFSNESGRFRHRLTYDRRWADEDGSEESHGRALWALGEAVARCQLRGHMTLAANLFQRALPACEQLTHPHGFAYSLIGIHAYLRRFSGDSHARRVRETLAHGLFDRFKHHATDDWMWHSDLITYGSSRLPHALLLSGRWMFNNEMIQLALRTLEWLWSIQTTPEGQFAPIGSDGWYPRNGERARFDQQPLEAAAMIDACLEAYRVTADKRWVDRAFRCIDWFLGDNDLHQPLYDPTTGGCAEALTPHSISEDQNAESTLAWLSALLALYDHKGEEDTAHGVLRKSKDEGALESRAPRPPRPRQRAALAESGSDG